MDALKKKLLKRAIKMGVQASYSNFPDVVVSGIAATIANLDEIKAATTEDDPKQLQEAIHKALNEQIKPLIYRCKEFYSLSILNVNPTDSSIFDLVYEQNKVLETIDPLRATSGAYRFYTKEEFIEKYGSDYADTFELPQDLMDKVAGKFISSSSIMRHLMNPHEETHVRVYGREVVDKSHAISVQMFRIPIGFTMFTLDDSVSATSLEFDMVDTDYLLTRVFQRDAGYGVYQRGTKKDGSDSE